MAIDAASSDNHIFARDDLGARPHDQIGVHTIHRVGIARLANFDDAPVFDANIPFDDAPMIDNQGVGDDQIQCTVSTYSCRLATLAHAVANHLAATKRNFITVDGKILLDLDDQFCIRQAYPIADGRAVQVCICTPWYVQAHLAAPFSCCPLLTCYSERTIHFACMPVDMARPAKSDQADLFLLAWLEAYRCTSSDVQAHAICGLQ